MARGLHAEPPVSRGAPNPIANKDLLKPSSGRGQHTSRACLQLISSHKRRGVERERKGKSATTNFGPLGPLASESRRNPKGGQDTIGEGLALLTVLLYFSGKEAKGAIYLGREWDTPLAPFIVASAIARRHLPRPSSQLYGEPALRV
jgi:hypothetical protein